MKTSDVQPKARASRSAASFASQRAPALGLSVDPVAIAQRRLAASIDHSPRMVAQRQQMEGAFGLPLQRQEDEELLQGRFEAIQRQEDEELMQGRFEATQRQEEEELLQGRFEATQRQEEEELMQGRFETTQRQEEEELMQGRFEATQRQEDEELMQGRSPGGMEVALQREPDTTAGGGLPQNLRAGVEASSGMDMSDVQVHRNSPEPAKVNALAFAKGNDIHLGAGQEKHLPHEAWHVVQQRQGRVQPTLQLQGRIAVNDDPSLEQEADVMGARALQIGSSLGPATGSRAPA